MWEMSIGRKMNFGRVCVEIGHFQLDVLFLCILKHCLAHGGGESIGVSLWLLFLFFPTQEWGIVSVVMEFGSHDPGAHCLESPLNSLIYTSMLCERLLLLI